MMSLFSEEGYIPFNGYKTWYGIIGEEEKQNRYPLLCLHGGPGAAHDYLIPIGKLSEQGRRVIFYDQLGAGNSDHPDKPEMWTVELYVEELGVIRKALGLDRVHILGQSWGGQLALEYTLTKPNGVESLILADSLADMSQWVSEANRLRSELPKETQAILDKHEAEGTIDDPEYEEAGMEFYRRHMCRLPVWPDVLNKTFEKFMMYPQVYNTMWGPNEFNVTGTLREWNIVKRLKEIDVPTLILSGRYDESTPAINKTLNDGIKGSEWVMFENSSHMPHLEEPEKYLTTLDSFLRKIESP
ncbi:MAG: proline iminopeptidase-family hydrolase [Candidatus Bathyarchaeota archaeon]|nr:proline iminopeptidase-family hydrolase [Candidatus Bathyarchaeota archaeon]